MIFTTLALPPIGMCGSVGNPHWHQASIPFLIPFFLQQGEVSRNAVCFGNATSCAERTEGYILETVWKRTVNTTAFQALDHVRNGHTPLMIGSVRALPNKHLIVGYWLFYP